MSRQIFRNIPSVNEILESPQLRKLLDRVNRSSVTTGVRTFLDNLRAEVQQAAADIKIPTPGELAESIAQWILNDSDATLQPVINATGTLLHTGLGQVPLASEAIDAISEVARGYSSVDINLHSGEKAPRTSATERLLSELTGADGAVITNNHASATLLTLAALAGGREVILSRGELVESADGVRLADMISVSGAQLREVGATNVTRVTDYEAAIHERTAALFKVHTSNFVVSGGTEQATLESLVALGRRRNLPVIVDIGIGAIVSVQEFGIVGELTASDCLKAGADVVLFSGHKLLGGPECGLIVGRSEIISRLHSHPLATPIQVDKLTLAALGATLRLFKEENAAQRSIPLLSLLSTPLENLKNRAERLAPQLVASGIAKSADPLPSTTFVGGVALKSQEISTWCVAVVPATGTADDLHKRLRTGVPSVLSRVQGDRLLLDLRTVSPGQDMRIAEAFGSIGKVESPDATL